jgi:hypothetical protein
MPSLHVLSAESYIVRMGVRLTGLLSSERNGRLSQVGCFGLRCTTCVVGINRRFLSLSDRVGMQMDTCCRTA